MLLTETETIIPTTAHIAVINPVWNAATYCVSYHQQCTTNASTRRTDDNSIKDSIGRLDTSFILSLWFPDL